jgi:hypothetical protein
MSSAESPPAIPVPTLSEQRAAKAVADAREWARDWERVAAFLSDHPEIAERAAGRLGDGRFRVHVMTDPATFMAAAARACVDAGGSVDEFRDDLYGGVVLRFGRVAMEVQARVDEVFIRRVTGVVEQVEYTLAFDLPALADEQPDGEPE